MTVCRWKMSHGPAHLVGHIADEPQVDEENGGRYMVFHLREAPGVEFRLKMLPTTPHRHQGDRVEVSYTQNGNGAVVEGLFGAPDPDVMRKRHKEYLANVEARDARH